MGQIEKMRELLRYGLDSGLTIAQLQNVRLALTKLERREAKLLIKSQKTKSRKVA